MAHIESPSLGEEFHLLLGCQHNVKGFLSLALTLLDGVSLRQLQSWKDRDSDNSVMRAASAFDPLQTMVTS